MSDIKAEPVAWGMLRTGGAIIDCKTPDEHARYAGSFTIPLYTADAIRAAVLAERERCAKVCDLHSRLTWNDDRKAQSRVLAEEIRKEPT